MNNRIVLYLSSILMAGCGKIATDNFPQPADLKIAICKSIDVPYEHVDTLIYNSFIGICGNSSQEELDRYYEPHLNEQPYFSTLQSHIKVTVLSTGDRLDTLMNALCADNTHVQTAWECFSKDKVVLYLTGYAIDNNSVRIVETYNLNDQSRHVEKVFAFKNGEWVFEIVKDTTAY